MEIPYRWRRPRRRRARPATARLAYSPPSNQIIIIIIIQILINIITLGLSTADNLNFLLGCKDKCWAKGCR